MEKYIGPLPNQVKCEYCGKRGYNVDIYGHVICKHCIIEKNPEYFIPLKKNFVPGRNDLCLCGSGKKYKRCCIK